MVRTARGKASPRFTSASAKPSSRPACLRFPAALVAACAVWLGAAAGGSAQTETLDRILAVVAGHVIMQSDVRAFIDLGLVDVDGEADPEEAALTYLIERRLVLDEVDRYVVADPSEAVVEQRVERVAARFRSAEAFAAALDRVGYAAADLRQAARDDARRDRYVDSRFGAVRPPTEDELRAHHRDHAGEFTAADGRPLPFDAVRALALRRVTAERRAARTADWVADLVRRGQVVRLSPAPRPPG